MSKTAFLFPGQGSQFVGMGREFHDSFPWAAEIFAKADEITAKPITRLCFDGPLSELTQTVVLQPAVTAVDLVSAKALIEAGLTPQAVAGHSLGEYPALAVAGVISDTDALSLVNLRGELMEQDAKARPGAMQAVIGLDPPVVESIVELARDRGIVVAANLNSPQQVVISGEGNAVATAVKFIEAKGGKHLPLPVSGAWHSPLMATAAEKFAEALGEVEFKTPSVPVYLNVTGKMETDPIAIKEAMTRQIVSPVLWVDIVFHMVAEDITRFVEVGPGKVLSGLVRKTVPKASAVGIVNVQDPAGVQAALAKMGS